MKEINRRTFLEFLGISTVSTLFESYPRSIKTPTLMVQSINAIPPSEVDAVSLAEGLHYEILIKWKDRLKKGCSFGFNNDFIAFVQLDKNNPDDGLLWVNHEYVDPRFVSGYQEFDPKNKTRAQVKKEMDNVGGSFIRVKKSNGKWEFIKNDPLNRRITGATEIPFHWPEPIYNQKSAMGTLANCSGGTTPWGTILTAEENYDMFYGERNHKTGERETSGSDLGWYKYFDNPPEHYGWIVEINPLTGEAKKHVALGRCAHEGATIKELADGRIVVYTGDDSINQCLYKFISSKPGSLSEGTLYVANTTLGKWISLDYDEQPVLQKLFKNQTEVLIRLREAARYLGGTPLDRPEDIEINPANGDVVVALTNNVPKGNWFGSIMKISEKGGKHDALEFTSDTFLAGGEETGFACPDNMAFDPKGNLWFTSDISGSAMNNEKKPNYLPFKNNSLFVVPKAGPQAGMAIRVANAPTHAEFTGPYFSPDGKTLFLSVQHPGEYSPSLEKLSSHWPEGGNRIPKPAVIAIYGVDEIV